MPAAHGARMLFTADMFSLDNFPLSPCHAIGFSLVNTLPVMAYSLFVIFHHAVAVLAQNPRLGLLAVSDLLEVERHTLERAFRVVGGRPFRQFRSDFMVQKVQALLAAQPARPIKEIAYLLGYKSPQSFARFVRTTLGRCPCELRDALTHTESNEERCL